LGSCLGEAFIFSLAGLSTWFLGLTCSLGVAEGGRIFGFIGKIDTWEELVVGIEAKDGGGPLACWLANMAFRVNMFFRASMRKDGNS
jgi:hypothetical protein